MIRLFRKIRHRLLSEKSYSLYILYASGEILLVVVGILLALQIDNWNENRKERAGEIQTLEEIKANLQRDLDDFDSNLVHFKALQISSKTLLDVIQNDGINHDSLGYFFFYLNVFPHFTPNQGGYQMLQSKGLDIVSNHDLRIAISNLYGNFYNYIRPFEKERYDYIHAILEPAMSSYKGIRSLEENDIPESLRDNYRIPVMKRFRNIVNFEQFKVDQKMHGLLKDIEDMSGYLYSMHESVRQEVLELNSLLEEELLSRKSEK